jgi:hypothetical protein
MPSAAFFAGDCWKGKTMRRDGFERVAVGRDRLRGAGRRTKSCRLVDVGDHVTGMDSAPEALVPLTRVGAFFPELLKSIP